MIESTPKAVAYARAAAACAYLSEVLSPAQMVTATGLLDVWVDAAGTDAEAPARQAIIDYTVALMRERGGCREDHDLAVLAAYVLHLLFPEDEPQGFREHWRDSAGLTWDDGIAEDPAAPAPATDADLIAYWEAQLRAI